MDPIKPTTVKAIQLDEFATTTLRSLKSFLLLRFSDWGHIDLDTGLPPANCDDAHTLYLSVCALLDDTSTPDLRGCLVTTQGGVSMDADSLLALGKAAARKRARHSEQG